MLLVHLHIHHLQQRPHLFESHFTVFVFVRFLEPVAHPPETTLRATVRETLGKKKKKHPCFSQPERILVHPLLLVHGLSPVDELAEAEHPSLGLLSCLCHQVQVPLAPVEHQREAELGGELLGDAQQDL